MYVLGTPELAKHVLAGEGDITRQGVGHNRGFATLIGKHSLLTVEDPSRHRYLRNLVMPAFTSDSVEALTPRMVAVVTSYLEKWACARGAVKAEEELKAMTFDFIMAVILGRDHSPEELGELRGLYAAWSNGLTAWPFLDLPLTPFGAAMAARRRLMGVFAGAVSEVRRRLEGGEEVPGILASLVSAVDEEGNRLSDEELHDNLMLLVLAGHDTSSVTLTNILAMLQQNREAVRRLRDEQRMLAAKRGGRLDGAALRDMPYAEAVIRETLRLRNVIPGLHRTAARHIELGGFAVPAGTLLYSPLTLMARTDARWAGDAPDDFRPERMMTQEAQKPGGFLPFGHGPRFCAGYLVAMAEMKVFLALLARGYDFECDTDTEWVQRVGQVPKNGLPTRIVRRAANASVS